MLSFNFRIIILLLVQSLFIKAPTFSDILPSTVNNDTGHYVSIVAYRDGFIAVSSEGKIDWISVSGKIEQSEAIKDIKLKCITIYNQQIVVAGDNGSIYISDNAETFRLYGHETNNDINTLVVFKENLIAGTNNGVILIGDKNGFTNKINLQLKGDIVSLSANQTKCYGVSNNGYIITSTDGNNWEIVDFNKQYSGYYPSCRFTRILATNNQIVISAIQNNKLPALFYSIHGTIWTQKELLGTNENGETSYLKEIPNDIFYDETQDQFVLVCNKGEIMILPSCSHCYKFYKLSWVNLTGISGNKSSIIVIGNYNFIKVLNY